MSPLPKEGYPRPPVWIEVDLSAIRDNLAEIRRLVGPRVQILAVVKANAYGHGLVPVAQAIVEAGVDLLGVASVSEGVTLRQHAVAGNILVLGQHLPEESSLIVVNKLTPAVGDREAASALSQAACSLSQRVGVHLKVDTGMNRYGVWHEEAVSLSQQLAGLEGIQMEGVLTHLSMGGQNSEATQIQLSRFSQVIGQLKKNNLPTGLKHAANSVGLIKFPKSRWDLVRTGLLLYGASPIRGEGQPIHLKPSLALKSRVRFLKTVPPGEGVSYGATFRSACPTKVATIPVGYAHGYTRALSNKADLLIRGVRAPVIGRITMEDLMCDVTNVAGVHIGDEVVLIGRQEREQISAEELARHARTIPYEILAGFSPGIPRFYL